MLFFFYSLLCANWLKHASKKKYFFFTSFDDEKKSERLFSFFLSLDSLELNKWIELAPNSSQVVESTTTTQTTSGWLKTKTREQKLLFWPKAQETMRRKKRWPTKCKQGSSKNTFIRIHIRSSEAESSANNNNKASTMKTSERLRKWKRTQAEREREKTRRTIRAIESAKHSPLPLPFYLSAFTCLSLFFFLSFFRS